MNKKADLIVINARIATMSGYSDQPQRGQELGALGMVERGAIAVADGKVLDVGPEAKLRQQLQIDGDTKLVDAGGRLVTPGLVDPHTHVVHYGSRENEYQMRLEGVPYIDILKAGGGILNSVRQNREATMEQIVEQSGKSLSRMLEFGVTTVEAKTGYGLDTETEIKTLKAIETLNRSQPVKLIPTFLGAHAIPVEYREHSDVFVDKVIDEMLPEAAPLSKFCDVFCEEHVFSVEQSRKVLQAAAKLGLGLKIHADELAPTGGAQLAVELGAVSADHLLCTDIEGIKALANSPTIAVLLPGTSFNLMTGKYAPARQMLEEGVALALATDYNPGSCPTENLQLIMTLGCLKLGMTPAQVLAAVTINAAHALGMADTIGSLERGKSADMVIFDADNEAYLPYHFGINHAWKVIKDGNVVVEK